jgi:hypothetical protein
MKGGKTMTRTRCIHLGIGVMLVLSLAAASPASARPDEHSSSPGTLLSTATAKGASAQATGPGVEPVVRIHDRESFHWGDAGIGAAAVFALAMIALGAGILSAAHKSRRRDADGVSAARVV